MKATWDEPEKTLDNGTQFSNDFYQRFTLRKAPQPLRMNESVTKDYLFPTFYGDVSCAVAVLMCSYDTLANIKFIYNFANKPVYYAMAATAAIMHLRIAQALWTRKDERILYHIFRFFVRRFFYFFCIFFIHMPDRQLLTINYEL